MSASARPGTGFEIGAYKMAKDDTQSIIAEYVPFESILLCGNALIAAKSIFKIGPNEPLRLGRSDDKPPYVWLSGPAGVGPEWLPLVSANVVVRNSLPQGRRLAVIQDVTQPLTVVMVGNTIVVSAVLTPDGKSVSVPNIDLRPIGLNIFGDEASGLNFGGGRFMKNTFHNVAAAFATGFPNTQR